MSDTPRYYKYFPQETIDLGTMPFEGDFTTDDTIMQCSIEGLPIVYHSNASGTEFGRMVTKKVGKRYMQVFEPGVTIGPVTYEGTPMPVWFAYYGDGVCTVKLPDGSQLSAAE